MAQQKSHSALPSARVTDKRRRRRHFRAVNLAGDMAKERAKSEKFRTSFDAARQATLVARQLRKLREERGLSQEKLARLVGTSQQVISRLEQPGYGGHSLSMLRRVVAALGGHLVVEIQP